MITNFHKAFIIYLHKNGFVLSLISVVLHPKEGIDCGHQSITIFFCIPICIFHGSCRNEMLSSFVFFSYLLQLSVKLVEFLIIFFTLFSKGKVFFVQSSNLIQCTYQVFLSLQHIYQKNCIVMNNG